MIFLFALFVALASPQGMRGANPPQVQLSGQWVATVYADNLVGNYHGAYWNGFNCTDYLGRPLPDMITDDVIGLAMPGAEFYCLPVVVCNREHCVTGVALDVPRAHRTERDGIIYNHLDLMPAMAEALGIKGIQYGDLEVYVR